MPNIDWFRVIRWVHVLSGASWLGAVALINAVIVPALAKIDRPARREAVAELFPRIFKFASVVSVTAIVSGGLLFYNRFSSDWSAIWSTPTGWGILIGATLATVLTAFHFVAEPRLEGLVREARGHERTLERVMRALKIVPRAGLAVLIAIILLMMYGARGL